jgi:Concanavalin A-like lectin/glucanases superfamily
MIIQGVSLNGVTVIDMVTPTFVTSGLQLYLNASNSTSYPGTGTTWTDLSGNSNNGTLVNSPVYTASPGYFTFNLANDRYVLTSGTISSLSAATFIAWVNSSQTQADYTNILMSRNGMGSATNYATGMNIAPGGNNNIGYHWNDNGSSYGWDSGLSVPNTAWSMIAVTVSSTEAIAYLCKSSGITTATNTTSHSPVVGPPLNFFISQDRGGGPGGGGYRNFIGGISQVAIYNTTLTSGEITSNFNNTKSIYGL